jgi:hypothetical protein
MTVELDHLFICTSVGAPEAACLAELGFIEGAPNGHPGQGTASRRFFFCNVYLELLWVHDAAEARSGLTRPICLWERWSGRADGACPFGFCFRPTERPNDGLPFATWQYRPAYLPDPLCIEVATNVAVLTEPMLCYLAFAQRSDRYAIGRRQPLQDPAGLREITRVKLVSPRAGDVSPEFEAVIKPGLIELNAGAEYLVELGFDGESQGKSADCRPALPLILRW